ncbi:hypothetical protein PVAP13_9NG833900 [Panicum virgatum]|uniref:Uncharacterized protein n=1 Tax=Panicum virgatum TaxID=38727 RepID=A0A8T0N453_PANVG|nr:hypothetical protein PVAP13_9NG833900 [Panicum virgatum]
MRGRSAGVRPGFQEIRRIMHRGWIAQPNSCQDCTALALSFFLPCLACNCQLMPRRLLFLFYSLQIKSELLQLRICDQHARTLCGQPAKILFQKHDVSDTVDQLLSKNPAGLTEDGIQLVKARVLDTAQGFFETSFTSNQAEAFKCPELVAECHMPLTCQVRHWISRNIIFVASFSILHCSGDCAPFTRDKHYQIELRKYMNRCVKPLKIML